MYAINSFTKIPALVGGLIMLLLGCFALDPMALAVVPAPDGGYPGGNTAEGFGALQGLTTGTYNTAIGQQALFADTTGSFNTAEGFRALVHNTTGPFNTAIGVNALYANTTAQRNVAIGFGTLFKNTTGAGNVAIGSTALYNTLTSNGNTATGDNTLYNTTGGFNVANGSNALFKNTTGVGNVGVGTRALYNNTTGSFNFALGGDAGFGLTTGNNNIDIGNRGVAGESGIIRIGTLGTHTDALLASKLTVDVVNTNNAATFVGRGNGNSTPVTHVVHIRNNQPSNSAILALQTADTAPSSPDNFITFFNGAGTAMGRIEAVNATTTQYVTTGSDFAETLPVAHSAQPGRTAEIVPVHGGKIGDWDQADHFMVISNQAGFVGNDPGQVEAAGRYHQIAFLGQVPVKIRGSVSSGDYVIASPANDGTGIAKPASKLSVADMQRVVGRAWESSAKEDLKEINTAVGLDQTSVFVPALQRLERENQDLHKANAALAQKLEALETRQARLENQFASRGVLVKN